MGFLDLNSWSSKNESDKSIFRESCIHILDLRDIFCVAETHLVHDPYLTLQAFLCYVHNRNRSGSGGVCALVCRRLIEIYDVSILDKSYESILQDSFKDKISGECLCLRQMLCQIL